jgi:3'(2'), 5'-bisphosphate nucleotidase
MAYEREVSAAVDAVIKASRLCASVQDRLIRGQTLEKGDKSPVTVADYGAQAVVGRLLSLEFPRIPMVGEENADALRDPANRALRDQVVDLTRTVLPQVSEAEVLGAIDWGVFGGGRGGRFWTLDPIDGTKGFLRMEQYAVALALVEDGEVVVGVLGCPNLETPRGRGGVYVGVKGEGAWWRPLGEDHKARLRATAEVDPAKTRITESVEAAHSDQSESALIASRLHIRTPPLRMDSQAKYAAVASGAADIYLRLPTRKDYVERIWDHAAGFRVITEAGGKVTDVRGLPLDFGHGRGLEANKGVVATNGHLHDEVLAIVRDVLAPHT